MQTQKRSINEKGFTLTELIVAMAMSLVVMGAIYSVFQTQQKSYIHQERVAAVQQNLRAALFMMEREIRMAGYDPTKFANAGIDEANSGSATLHFTLDDNGDGTIDSSDDKEDILYTLSGTDLLRNGQVVAEYISSLVFSYLDVDNNGTNETVQINVVATTQKGQITSRNLTTNIKCRNIN